MLRVRSLQRGRIAMVAVEGLCLPEVLGSVSTYPRAALGGIDGRALAAGAARPRRRVRHAGVRLPRRPRRPAAPCRAG